MGHLTFFGTGTSQGVPVIGCRCDVCTSTDPRDARLRTSAGVEYEGMKFIIDVGPDFRTQCLRSGWDEADAVLLTHAHQDHVAGLDDLRPFIFKSGKEMPVYADEFTLNQVVDRFSYAFGGTNYPGAPRLTAHCIDQNETLNIGPAAIEPIPIMHGNQPILGFRFGSMAYLTDVSSIPPASLEKLQNLDVLVLNALRIEPHHSHLHLDSALEYIEQINPKTTYLIHISHLLGLHEAVEKQLPAGVHLAQDGITFDF